MNIGSKIINIPSYFSNLKYNADIAYGQNHWQKLDIYSSKTTTQNKPVIIFFYGGRWSSGTKEEYRFVATKMAKAGYLVVIPDYIKYPQGKLPEFMDDAAHAAAWVKNNISQYGGDSAKLYVMGHSAGAHIGALLISDASYLKKYGTSPKIIKAFAGIAGPYDFTPDEHDLQDMFGPPENYFKMQVPSFITGKEPPMLLLYGDKDQLVAPYNLTRLESSIRAHNGKVAVKIYPGMGHISILANFAKPGHSLPSVAQDCIDFFGKYSN